MEVIVTIDGIDMRIRSGDRLLLTHTQISKLRKVCYDKGLYFCIYGDDDPIVTIMEVVSNIE